MSKSTETVQQLLQSIGVDDPHQLGENTARLQVHGNTVVGSHLVPGLDVDVDELDEGIAARIVVQEGAVIEKPVHVCFGLLPEEGLQYINLHVDIQADSQVSILAHCTFPNAKKVEHRMDAAINVAPGARYSYFERHVHGPYGGVLVVPKAKVLVKEGARFKTEFELIKGRAGEIAFDYEAECQAGSVLEMLARIKGVEDDRINIRETAHLTGENARAALTSHIALRNRACAEVYNELTATAAGARGHVDCKEIVQDQAQARVVPVVDVRHPKAHVTHEAAIGSVDSKQLETLLSRGLDEDAAVDVIIEGLLT